MTEDEYWTFLIQKYDTQTRNDKIACDDNITCQLQYVTKTGHVGLGVKKSRTWHKWLAHKWTKKNNSIW